MTRILFISYEDNPQLRTILGYIVIRNTGHIMFWCKEISFAKGRLPDHYHQYTSIILMVKFSQWFRIYPKIYRSGEVVSTASIIFAMGRIIVHNYLINRYDEEKGDFVVHSYTSKALVEIYNTFKASGSRAPNYWAADDDNSQWFGM